MQAHQLLPLFLPKIRHAQIYWKGLLEEIITDKALCTVAIQKLETLIHYANEHNESNNEEDRDNKRCQSRMKIQGGPKVSLPIETHIIT